MDTNTKGSQLSNNSDTSRTDIRNITASTPNKIPKVKWISWLILSFSALNVIFLGGKRRAFGIFVAELHNGVFNTTSLAELNWIGDSYAALGYLTTICSSTIIIHFQRKYRIFQFVGSCFVLVACVSSAYVKSAHMLFLTHTVFHGIGSSLILSTVGLVVNEHFDANHPYHILATTLVSGGSVASIVFVQFYAYLIERYGWRRAFIVLGLIYFVVNFTGVIFFQRKQSGKSTGSRLDEFSLQLRHLLNRNRMSLLLLWFGDRIITSIVTYGMLLNLADFLKRHNRELTKSTSLTLLFAAGEASTYVIGTIVGAFTKKLFLSNLRYILLSCSILMAISLVIWETVVEYPSWCLFLAYFSGFCLGPSITFLFPAGEEMTALPGDIAYPFSLAGMGVGMLLSPTLSATIIQQFQYKWFFLVQGCLIWVKCVLLGMSIVILWKHKHILDIRRRTNEDGESLLNSESDQLSMMKRENSSFQPLPLVDDAQSLDNGWDHIDLMDAIEIKKNCDDRV